LEDHHVAKGVMGIDFLDNYVMLEISTHVDITFFSQNKPMNNHPKFVRYFMRHCTVC
jgi:hypothetical protein